MLSRECFEGSVESIFAAETEPNFAVLIIGMDHFKAMNDEMGHEAGDAILNLAGQRLKSTLRVTDRIARLVGDEFAILLNPIISAQDAKAVADRLADLLHRAYLFHGQVMQISASIGISVSPHDGADSEALMRRAGLALSCAKASSPGAVQLFETSMESRMIARHALSFHLRKALLLHQMEVHYQPQIDIASHQLIGFEALLRWRHPEFGYISPAEFIPLAEELGLIGMIGDWVLRAACEQAARLPAEIVIAVNVSPLQFKTESFLESVEGALLSAGIPGSRIEIEITEGALLHDTDAVLSTLDHLHLLGARLAMDDFGTGYSSLGQLAKFPFDTIKIDRSLMGGGTKQRAIVRAVATLGLGLGMSVLAEGIETEEELVKAHSDGCMFVQGYLFGKAVPASKLDSVLARFSPHLYQQCEPVECKV